MNNIRCRILMLAGSVVMATPVFAQQVVVDHSIARTVNAEEALARPVTIRLDHVELKRAVYAIAQSAGIRLQAASDVLEAVGSPITLHANRLPLGKALTRVLMGTKLRVTVLNADLIEIAPAGETANQAQGVIVGRLTDAKTKLPLRGARIRVDGFDRGESIDDGSYRISNLGAGTHTVMIKLIGYIKATRTVTVPDGETVTLDIILEPSAATLEQVVVTGTVIPTEIKAVPNAITVITAKQIEERGITKIDQLFRGDVPGLFAQNQGSLVQLDEVTMFSRGATALSAASAGTQFNITNPIKTYIDGVELADPQYLSQIDPKSIERIEILTGPQASTIYGSNAINGVMQIFTKRGTTSRPQVTLNLLSGFVENNFSRALTPQHDYSASVSGLEGRISYNVGGSWNYMGRWTPAKQLARTGGFGGASLTLPTVAGPVTADVTLRRTLTQSLRHGDEAQTLTGNREAGWYTPSSSAGLAAPATRTLTGQTLGVTLSYAIRSWWSNELGVGTDVSDTELRFTAPGYLSPSDTTLQLTQSHIERGSLRYSTTARIPITSFAQLTVTGGVDSWQTLTSSLSLLPQTLTGSLTGSNSISRRPGHNAGEFAQTQLGISDRLFFTYGLRIERNPTIGDKARAIPGRYGATYTQEVGPFTAKLRGSYGRSIRPPTPTLKDAVPQTSASAIALWGNYSDVLANPKLAPEYQQGGEGGLELYLSTRGSIVVTRYNQTVDQLIAQVSGIDSVRTLKSLVDLGFNPAAFPQWTDGFAYARQSQYLNLGSIRNQGWELQGSVNMGPFTTRGTYSWTKSRVIGVTPLYRAFFSNNAQYRPGASFQFLPEHTWALGVTYASARSSVGINLTGMGRVTNVNDAFFLQNLSNSVRLSQTQSNLSSSGGYINFNAPYALADVEASHRFSSRSETLFQVQNCLDKYTNDFNAAYASLGRQVKVGVRIRP